jgi:predicted choloylglycine hydrolase
MNQPYTFGQSTLKIGDGIWLLRVRENSYFESGLAIGTLLAQGDYPAVRLFKKRLTRALVGILYFITKRDFRRVRIPERYLEELQGSAQGSGLSYKVLFFMNFVFDVLKKYGFHCSSVALTEKDVTLVGRNTDLIPWIARAAVKWFPPVVLDIQVPGKLRCVHVIPGLFLGALSGFNERGLAMMSHQIAATKEKSVAGSLATPLLQRMILEEASNMDDADAVIRNNPIQRCISDLLTSSAEGKSRVYEITPGSIKIIDTEDRFLCCATHFTDTELTNLQRYKTTVSEGRLALMNSLAATTQAVPSEVIAMLRNFDNGLAHTKSGSSPTNEGTYQSMVFDITGRRIFISDGTTLPVSLSGNYQEILLEDG